MKNDRQTASMGTIHELETERLILRQWKDSDLPVFAAMSADTAVMEYFPKTLSEEESHAMAETIRALMAERGWGLWAVETKAEGAFIGFVGLHEPAYELPFTPCVEVGWRLGRTHWRKGYATEAARESLRFAFEALDLDKVYAFASLLNKRSLSVMERLGMENTGRNFEHPSMPEGHPLREHALYRMAAGKWLALGQ